MLIIQNDYNTDIYINRAYRICNIAIDTNLINFRELCYKFLYELDFMTEGFFLA